MHCRCKLKVERRVVFRLHVLAVWLFAHLDVGNRIAAFLQIRHLRCCIVGRAVEQRDGNHGRKIVGDAAGEEEIKPRLVAVLVDVGGRVPRVDRGTERSGLVLIGTVLHQVDQIAVRRQGSNVHFTNGIAHRATRVLRIVRGVGPSVCGVGRFRHPDAKVTHGNWRGSELESASSAFGVGDNARGESGPDTGGGTIHRALIRRFLRRPVLHFVIAGIGIEPVDADVRNGLVRPEINHDPLRVRGVGFAGVLARQVRIALPI